MGNKQWVLENNSSEAVWHDGVHVSMGGVCGGCDLNPSPPPQKKCQSEGGGGPALTKIEGGGVGRDPPPQKNVSLRGGCL